MTPEQATAMRDFFLSIIEEEIPISQKLIRAIPESGASYKPDEKSRTAFELARHLPVGDLYFLNAVAAGAFGEWDPSAEEAIKSFAAAAAIYDEKWPAAIAKVRALSGEALAKPLNMMGAFEHPVVIYLSFLIRHQVHHRGQLAAYARAAGGTVPSIYGGSADEPWQPPSE
jgi:uncharacterized damage-inducible protein DinB